MSWEQLLGIMAQQAADDRAWRNTPPVACPIDGAVLVAGPDDELNCPMGNYQYPRDGHPSDHRAGP